MKKNKSDLIRYLFFLSAILSIALIILISFFLFKEGTVIFKEVGFLNFILGKDWSPTNTPSSFGILPMILGSLYITLIAILIGGPVGIITAVFLVYYTKDKHYRFLKSIINLMAGIPSIIYGFFGMVVLVPAVRYLFPSNGNSILTAGILLSIMILPTVINLSEVAIRAVPRFYYEGALALGSSKERSIFKVVLPAAKSGVISSLILGIGRAVGETMAVVMVAGNQPRMPKGIFKGARTLTTNIVMEMSYASGVHRNALIGTAVVLFMIILIINLVFTIFKERNVNG